MGRGNIGGIWLKHTKKGDKFLSGVININDDEKMSFTAFKNTYKEKPNQPDYIIYKPLDQQSDDNKQDYKRDSKKSNKQVNNKDIDDDLDEL